MDADERAICIYLKSWPGQFVSGREIGRRAGGKHRFRRDPDWAIAILGRLVEKGIIETDTGGHFRLVKRERKEQGRKWVSPQIKKLLEKSGKDFEKTFEIEGSDDLDFLDED